MSLAWSHGEQVVREKLFKRLYKELPYEMETSLVSFKHLRDGSLRCELTVWVPNERVRAMVVGRDGAVIGEVGRSARLELQHLLNNKVHLILNVRARER